MDKAEVMALMNNLEKENVQRKIGYWQIAGSALLENDGLSEKWSAFVEQQANNDFVRGALLDETLQIMSMIKANVPADKIALTLEQIEGGETVLDDYLGAFIHPEILDEIQSHLEQKTR